MKAIFIIAIFTYSTNVLAQVPNYVPTDGLVGFWSFSGNANDESGNGLDGTVTGATLTTDRNGDTGGAYLFNPSITSSIIIDTESITGPSLDNDFSIMMWVKANREVNMVSESIVCPVAVTVPMANSNQNWALRPGNFGADLGVGFSIGTNGVMVANHATNILINRVSNSFSRNDFVNVVITHSNNNVYLYIDGMLVNSITNYCSDALKKLTSNIALGASLYSPNFSGVIDDFGIWNRALTQVEVSAIYNENSASICKKISFTRLLDENDDPLVVEVSTDEWHYLAFTKADDLSGKIFLDGNLVGSGNFLDVGYNYNQLYIGASFFTSWDSFYKGWIDDFRVSNTVREDSEISANYQSNTPFITDANTIGLWHFDETSGNEFGNSVSSTNGNLFNGAAFDSGRFSNSVYFDGIDDRGDCNIDIPESNITFEIWIKIEGEEQLTGHIFQAYGLFNTYPYIFDDCETLEVADELITQSIKLYPNPVTDKLTIDSKTLITKVDIYSINGKKVREINSNFNNISTDNLVVGVYIVKIHSENGFVIKKLIKK